MRLLKSDNVFRDIIFALALALLVHLAFENELQKHVQSPLTTLHRAAPSSSEHEYIVHTPDQTILDRIHALQENIKLELQNHPHHRDFIALSKQVEKLAHDYTHTSGATALLGPIGTAGVVLKERKLEEALTHFEREFRAQQKNLLTQH